MDSNILVVTEEPIFLLENREMKLYNDEFISVVCICISISNMLVQMFGLYWPWGAATRRTKVANLRHAAIMVAVSKLDQPILTICK